MSEVTDHAETSPPAAAAVATVSTPSAVSVPGKIMHSFEEDARRQPAREAARAAPCGPRKLGVPLCPTVTEQRSLLIGAGRGLMNCR